MGLHLESQVVFNVALIPRQSTWRTAKEETRKHQIFYDHVEIITINSN